MKPALTAATRVPPTSPGRTTPPVLLHAGRPVILRFLSAHRCQFAGSWDRVAGVFFSLKGPPHFQAQGTIWVGLGVSFSGIQQRQQERDAKTLTSKRLTLRDEDLMRSAMGDGGLPTHRRVGRPTIRELNAHEDREGRSRQGGARQRHRRRDPEPDAHATREPSHLVLICRPRPTATPPDACLTPYHRTGFRLWS